MSMIEVDHRKHTSPGRAEHVTNKLRAAIKIATESKSPVVHIVLAEAQELMVDMESLHLILTDSYMKALEDEDPQFWMGKPKEEAK